MCLPTIKAGGEEFTVLFPDLLRALTDAERERLRASIKAKGMKVPVAVNAQNGVIDGIHRLTIAKELDLNYIPTALYAGLNGEEERELAISLNRDRRQLSLEELKALRAGRVEKTTEKRQEGKSERQIAEELGVSKTQVHRDLEESGGPPGPPDESADKVTGKDGKKYTKKTPKALCDRCQRTGEVKNCERCKEVRKAAKNGKPKKMPKAPQTTPEAEADAREPGVELLDAEGTEVPAQALPAFAAAKELGGVCRQLDGLIARVKELGKGPGGRMMHVDSMSQGLKAVRQALWGARATHVCSYCQGDDPKCKPCGGEGWLDSTTWANSPAGFKKNRNTDGTKKTTGSKP